MSLESVAAQLSEKSRKYNSISKDMQADLRADLRKYLNKNPNKVLFYQNQQLFKKSVDASGKYGEELGFYSKSTEVISKGKKKYNKPFTMVDSGSFKRGMTFKMKYNKLIFYSTGSTTDDILSNPIFGGLELFGLNEDSMRRLMNNVIRPFIRIWIKDRLSQL